MALDTKYRVMSLETLEALKGSMLLQIKNIEGAGQSHSLNGRSTSQASLDTLLNKLGDIEAAIAWKKDPANAGNNGYTSRFTDFSRC